MKQHFLLSEIFQISKELLQAVRLSTEGYRILYGARTGCLTGCLLTSCLLRTSDRDLHNNNLLKKNVVITKTCLWLIRKFNRFDFTLNWKIPRQVTVFVIGILKQFDQFDCGVW